MIGPALLGVGGLVALVWTVLAIRLVWLTRGPWFRFLQAAGPSIEVANTPTVAAIIPARNEEAHVAATVASLRRQDYPNLTLTLVDDESTDSTFAILQRLQAEPGLGLSRLEVVQGVERPTGWVGKTWAVHQGTTRATDADWLWFVDADMGLDPAALRTALVEALRTDADLVSFLPGVRCETFWQRTVAISFLHILALLFPLNRVNDPACSEALAAGGFILVRRSAYEQAGGHEAVRHAIIEDIELARNIKRAGGKLAVRLAPQLAWTHMYGSFAEIWVGMRKNAYAGMDFMPHKFVVGAIVALILAWAPLTALIGGWVLKSPILAIVGGWGIIAQVFATMPNLIFTGVAWPYALALPAGISAYVAITTASVWHYHRGHILWKGRSISVSTMGRPVASEKHPDKLDKKLGQNPMKRR